MYNKNYTPKYRFLNVNRTQSVCMCVFILLLLKYPLNIKVMHIYVIHFVVAVVVFVVVPTDDVYFKMFYNLVLPLDFCRYCCCCCYLVILYIFIIIFACQVNEHLIEYFK